MLQSIGMTGRQLKTMLVYEGFLFAPGAILVSLVLSGKAETGEKRLLQEMGSRTKLTC